MLVGDVDVVAVADVVVDDDKLVSLLIGVRVEVAVIGLWLVLCRVPTSFRFSCCSLALKNNGFLDGLWVGWDADLDDFVGLVDC